MTAKKTLVALAAGEKEAEATPVEETEDTDSAESKMSSWIARLERFFGRLSKESAEENQWSARIGVAALIFIVVSALSVFAGLYWYSYRPDQQVDAEAAKAAIAAAGEGTVAILSYSPDTLDHDFSIARSHLTGEFLSYYDQFTQRIVAPAAKEKAVRTTAVVLRSALSEFHPDLATVLIFIKQSTQSKDGPEPTMTNSSVLVTLTKADGKWLISQFNPS